MENLRGAWCGSLDPRIQATVHAPIRGITHDRPGCVGLDQPRSAAQIPTPARRGKLAGVGISAAASVSSSDSKPPQGLDEKQLGILPPALP